MPFAFGGTGTGGGGGLDIDVVQALPVYQEDIRVAPVFYFRRSDNTYHQAFSEPLAADEAASMTRNVLAQANITGNATWRGTVDNLNDIVTPAADDWAFEHRAGHNRLWWYDGTTWYGSDHPGRPSIETAFGADYVFLRPDGTFATDGALRDAFNDRDIDYDASKQYLFLDVADDNVHRVTAFSPFIPAGTKKNFVNVGVGTFDAAAMAAIADAEIDSGVKDYAKTGGGQIPDGDIPADIARDSEIPTDAEIDARADARVTAGTKVFAQAGGRLIEPTDADAAFMLDNEFNGAAIRAMLGFTQAEQDALLEDDNARIDAGVLILPRLDGTDVRLTLPQAMGAADGVIDGFTFAADLSSLTISRSQGADITVNIPAGLRAVPRTDAEINALRGNRLLLSSATTYDAANDRLTGDVGFTTAAGDVVTFIMPTGLTLNDDALMFRASATDPEQPLHDRDGNDLSTNDVAEGRLYSVMRFASEYRLIESPSDTVTPPVQMHLRYAAIRTADGDFTAADFTAAEATTSQTNTIDTPDTTDNAFLAFAIPDSVNDLSDIRQEGGLFSYFGSFTLSATLVELDGEDHKVYISNFALNADLIGDNWVLTPS